MQHLLRVLHFHYADLLPWLRGLAVKKLGDVLHARVQIRQFDTINLYHKGVIMAVNLKKPFKGPEYTPTHLMDEAESIRQLQSQRSTTVPEAAQSLVGNSVPDTQEAEAEQLPEIQVVEAKQLPATLDTKQCMSQILEDIANASADDQEYFISEFYKGVKANRKLLKAQKRGSSKPIPLIHSVIFLAIFSLGALYFPDSIESWILNTGGSTKFASFVTCLSQCVLSLGMLFFGGMSISTALKIVAPKIFGEVEHKA